MKESDKFFFTVIAVTLFAQVVGMLWLNTLNQPHELYSVFVNLGMILALGGYLVIRK
jgi:hypothetical protein